MKYLATLFVFLLTACTTGGQVRLDTPTVDDLADNVVALVTEDGHAYCSGTIIPEGVLTAAHCVHGESEVLIGLRPDLVQEPGEDYWQRSFRVPVIDTDEEMDLALLGFNGEPEVVVSVENPRLGDAVVAVGHPLGIAYTVHQGHVSGILRHGFTRDFMLTDVGLIGGMSGGAIFNEHGHLVGVISFTICESPFSCSGTLGGFIPAETVQEFLR